jgi:hypothetical protein
MCAYIIDSLAAAAITPELTFHARRPCCWLARRAAADP